MIGEARSALYSSAIIQFKCLVVQVLPPIHAKVAGTPSFEVSRVLVPGSDVRYPISFSSSLAPHSKRLTRRQYVNHRNLTCTDE
jgi:hypothetical protein